MGLHLCFELHAPDVEAAPVVSERLATLRARAAQLPFAEVSPLVQLTETDLTRAWPMRGLAFERLEDVVDVAARSARQDLYRRHMGIPDDDYSRVDVPKAFPVVAVGFAVAPGDGCEPAAFGLATTSPPVAGGWSWHYCCKTQYASLHGDENLLRCHGSLVAVLDAARGIGFDVAVRDETGYWDSRDERQLLAQVAEMNRVVARFAGAFVDQTRDAGVDSRQIRGTIFEHPDFERLETEE